MCKTKRTLNLSLSVGFDPSIRNISMFHVRKFTTALVIITSNQLHNLVLTNVLFIALIFLLVYYSSHGDRNKITFGRVKECTVRFTDVLVVSAHHCNVELSRCVDSPVKSPSKFPVKCIRSPTKCTKKGIARFTIKVEDTR